ncbi:hypothetical protein PAHAL_4G252300 [Panicum hallii]|nr:hypothetical protein PAHAL_4G252300 [Panicum hallii]
MLWSMPATPHLPPMLHMASTSHMPSMPHMQPMASMPFMASMPPMPWGFPPQLLQSQMPLGFTPLSTYVPRSPGAASGSQENPSSEASYMEQLFGTTVAPESG